MQIPLIVPQVTNKQLLVETANLFRGARLLVDGIPVSGNKGRYIIRADSGEEIVLALKHYFFDPIPKVKFEGNLVELAPNYSWYEFIWVWVPVVLLLFVNGIVGAITGIGIAYLNAHIFRSSLGAYKKYGFSIIILVVVVFLSVFVSAVFQFLNVAFRHVH